MSTRLSGWSAVSLILTVLALVSCAAPPHGAAQALRTQKGNYELEVLVDGAPVRTFAHAGETHVLGHQGDRYVLRIHNHSARRIEAVVTVDGLDVIDGESGDFANKRGYLVPAYGYVDIDGWRLSNQEAAAFRFAAIGDSYAAKTGRARNVGVIGVAVFPERVVPPAPRPYRPAPRDDYDGYPGYGGLGESKARPSREAEPSAEAAAAPQASAGRAEDRASSKGAAEPARRQRSGLGTEFGEAMYSQIEQVSFTRANPGRPATLLGARYNDRAGLLALGIDVDGVRRSEVSLRQSADPFPVTHGFARPPRDWRGN
jgi:hypothetical protein